ncbi:ATP-binding protein [Halomonas urumqiensis]|uniref:histidine kinase n=1 Tax=Halomonas urumqiensis TaxID=1684789 RepID=A0A2N7UJD2_9GAMM|nr:ATP-binding protein [Halomonas urumqiensis]PMR80515.1 two-component sensor histidine kinase [Halomonas urumqiensis]PTB01640.1 HAMP domain-containing protein [Halomonas urumqiensis]GHE22277.1 two-component sensor histidine kinase [Halomonas urumqiensis]
MRRALADSTFLRVYVLLALALLLTFGLALLGLAMVDQVRREHHREQLAQAPMRLLTENLAALEPDQYQMWLTRQARHLDMTPLVLDIAQVPLNFFSRTRLERGSVLVHPLEEQGWRLQSLLPGGEHVLQVEMASLSEHQLRGLTVLLGEWLLEVDVEARAGRLERVLGGNIPVELRDTPPESLDPYQLTRLDEGEVVIRLLPGRWSMAMYLELVDSKDTVQWLVVGPVESFEPLPGELLLVLVVILLAVLAATIYLIVRGVEARMARLELAATRIAGGRLDTRVKVESGDFLGRLGMAFNGMATQVQSLLRAQQDMIRAVSHELRTPVARIRFAVQMVEDMTDEPSIRRQLQGIDGDIEELDGLIDEILTYARLGSDAVNGREIDAALVDCRSMAERVIDALRPLHGHLELSLAEGPDVEAIAEPRYLQRAVQNLVANACRHARSRVVIRLQGEPQLVRVDVEDDGPGVPAEQRQEVFKPFARLDDSRTRSSGGYGLGLSIVQKVMTWHGGSVAVDESPELGGARFTLLLPQRRETLPGN